MSLRLLCCCGHHPSPLTCCAIDTSERVTLFNEIASFVDDRLSSAADEPASKRRRVDVDQSQVKSENQTNGSHASKPPSTTNSVAAAAAEDVLLVIKDISVSVPQRKKYDLCFSPSYLYARPSGASEPVQGMMYAWKDIGRSPGYLGL